MHYKNGTLAKEGDHAIFPAQNGTGSPQAGILFNLNGNAETCNGQLAVTQPGGCGYMYVNIKDGYSAADAFQAAEVQTLAQQSAPPTNS